MANVFATGRPADACGYAATDRLPTARPRDRIPNHDCFANALITQS